MLEGTTLEVGGAVIGAGVRVGLKITDVTVAPIVKPACCIVVMKSNPPSPSKALDSSCSRSSADTDNPSYSSMIFIKYLKVSSLLIVLLRQEVTAVIVMVMLFTLALGRVLSMAASAYSSAMVWRAASSISPGSISSVQGQF